MADLTLLVLLALYLLPTLIAAVKQKRNAAAIAVVNLLTGWTGIGWVVALVWAVAYEQKD